MDPDSNDIVQAKAIGKQVSSPEGSLTILADINLSIKRSESLAVIGVSGSGKSTLLGLLAGLDTPTSGKVILDGTILNDLDEDGRSQIRNQSVGFVFQSFHLLPGLTALENTALPLELAGSEQSDEIARQRLADVGLNERIHHYPDQLSGGEQQRVAIARAFACNPKILFADEPTGNLDKKTAQRIIDLMFKMNKNNGTTLVLVTHDDALASLCDRKVIMTGGQIINDMK
jgi:putative ABC transport system ATP-binding protein